MNHAGFREYCSACQRRSSKFLSFNLGDFHVEGGIIPDITVANTVCPWCGSHIHHRLMWSVIPDVIRTLKNQEVSANGHKTILNFAPEKFSEIRLKRLEDFVYISTDIMRKDVMVQLDMCNLGVRDDSIGLIIASHVLEHVPNDLTALSEIYRVLCPGGIAILLVPILAENSFELGWINNDIDRIRYYGQSDHLRAYGTDFVEKLRAIGFEVQTIYAKDFKGFSHANYLLDIQGVLFFAQKS